MTTNSFEVLYNNCYGGYTLSQEVCELYHQKYPEKCVTNGKFNLHCLFSESFRTDPHLIEIVKELGSKRASGLSLMNTPVCTLALDKVTFDSRLSTLTWSKDMLIFENMMAMKMWVFIELEFSLI